ncbi:hypothetical protein ACTXG7_05305 [Mycolicibacterium sp. Dal123E01]|uniref:hypothetical protein n=1 Tax=Mycolicibacterium sp. Dal123E01 TaxID=3457578 RepID=UPI00403EEAF0
MSLNNLDTTVPMRTQDELHTLVQAIYDSPGGQETNWLEWKCGHDLSTNEGRFAVSKAILGFANRAVDQAQQVCEGLAYMVVGVEPGAAPGVSPFDHATLSQRVKTYVDGPRWTPNYVPFEGVTVLVIVIEAPRAGHRIHTLQKEFSNGKSANKAGTVFHRSTAHTEPAGPKEIAMLEDRLLAGTLSPDLDLRLSAHPDPLLRLDLNPDSLQDWLVRHEVYVRANNGAPADQPPPRPKREPQSPIERIAGLYDFSPDVSSTWMRGLYADPKDRDEYERRFSSYFAKLRHGALTNAVVRAIVRGNGNKIAFNVGNDTNDSVTGIQLSVTVPSLDLVVFTTVSGPDPLPPLPRWPDHFKDMLRPSPSPSFSPHDLHGPTTGSLIDMGDAYEITWDIGNLRPGEWAAPVEVTVIPSVDTPSEVEVKMVARAMDRRRSTNATAMISVVDDKMTIEDFYEANPDRPE